MKTCLICEETKSLDSFWKSGHVTLSGNQSRRNQCSDCLLEKQRIKKGSKKTRKNGEVLSKISGNFPGTDEVSVYILCDDLGEAFYVGSSGVPNERMHNHLQTFGDNITMVLVRNVPKDSSIYWESKLFVEYYEAGYNLQNREAPRKISK